MAPFVEVAIVSKRLYRWSHENPNKPAFIFRGGHPGNPRVVLTRGDVYKLTSSFCSLARDIGVGHGDLVCNTLPNCPERVITDLGLMMMGAVTVNGMVYLADGEDLTKCLSRSGCVALVVDPTQPGNALSVLGDRIIVRGENAQSRVSPSLRKVFNVDCGGGHELRPWLDQLKHYEESHPPCVAPTDTAIIYNCAGIVAFSRFVSRTQQQFITMGETLHDLAEIGRKDIVFNDKSLGWYDSACCLYVAKGTPVVMTDMTIPPKEPLFFSWETCLAEQCTVCFLPPPAISTIMAKPALWKNVDSKIRNIIACRMPLSKLQVSAVGQLCENLIATYSSAEVGFVTKNRISIENKQDFEDGDFGPAIGGFSIKLVNSMGKDISPTQAGVTGDLLVQGPLTTSGYLWIQPSEKVAVSTNGDWMKTNDVAYYNARGHIHIVCRKHNAIINGDHIILPCWLEERLARYSGVHSLAIVPVPDPKMFQEMCVCIVPDRGIVLKDNDIKEFCETLYIKRAPLKQIPKFCVYLREMPMKDDNVIDKKRLLLITLEALGFPMHEHEQ